MSKIDTSDLYIWLKGKKRTNLRTVSNVLHRSLGFADISSADYITCDMSSFIKDKKLYNIYIRINSDKEKHKDGAMLSHWLESLIL